MSGIMQNRKDEPFDIVKKPKHYNQGKYEAIDVIENTITKANMKL